MKTKAVQTDKYKDYCKFCGTWTIGKKGCININHNHFKIKKANKFKGENNE